MAIIGASAISAKIKAAAEPAEVAAFDKPSESLAEWRSQRVAAASVSAVQ
jgi:hypothetical protein